MDGVLIINKPAGMTSHDVVARVRRLIGERRVGHTGTLDPFATGVLVVLIGRATRLAQFLSGAEKEYEAVIRFGYSTDTGDVTGQRIETDPHAKAQSAQSLRKEEIEAAMASLRGPIKQLPPMYSAKKIAGRKLYEHARRGEEVERKPVDVTIHEFDVLPGDGEQLKRHDDESADLSVRVVCSAGTYVRTLAQDLGGRLNIGAHLASLRRTRAGHFTIANAMTLDRLAELNASQALEQALIAPNESLSHLAGVELDDDQAQRTRHGIDLQVDSDRASSWQEGQPIRMTLKGRLIAIGRFEANQRVMHPAVVLTTE